MQDARPRAGSPNEFSRFIKVSELPKQGSVFRLEAKPDECKALCARLALHDLSSFVVQAKLTELLGEGCYVLKGSLSAKFQQKCAITDIPVALELEEDFDEVFSKYVKKDQEGDDDAEPLEKGGIDIGEVAVQYLSLSMPEFARASDEEIEAYLKALKLESILKPLNS